MRKALVIVAIMVSLVLAEHLSLVQLWSYKTGGAIYGLAFSDNGNLGVASADHCAYILDPNGILLNKICGNNTMEDASYLSVMFGFINADGYAYITDVNGNLIKKVYVGGNYTYAITMIPDGFMACGLGCAFFEFNGTRLWSVYAERIGSVWNGPSYYESWIPQYYWFVAGDHNLFIISNGSIVNSTWYGESAYDTALCGNYYLAVSTEHHLYLYLYPHLYDLGYPANPREIWNVGGFNEAYQIAFSPDCKYIAVADTYNNKLKIYDINGNLVLEKSFDSPVFSVAWWNDRIAVGLYDGSIYMYMVESYTPSVATATQTTQITAATITQTTTQRITVTKVPGVALLGPIALATVIGKKKKSRK